MSLKDVVGRVEHAVGARVAEVPGPLLREHLDGDRRLRLRRVLVEGLREVLEGVVEQGAVDTEEDDRGDHPGEDQARAAGAVLVVRGATGLVFVHEGGPEEQTHHDDEEHRDRDRGDVEQPVGSVPVE